VRRAEGGSAEVVEFGSGKHDRIEGCRLQRERVHLRRNDNARRQ